MLRLGGTFGCAQGLEHPLQSMGIIGDNGSGFIDGRMVVVDTSFVHDDEYRLARQLVIHFIFIFKGKKKEIKKAQRD